MSEAWLDDNHELFKLIRDAVDNDGYLWIVVHGPPRSSKSTLALWASYYIYRDWDKVLKSVVFNLSGVMQRIKSGTPERWPSLNGLHSRVPIIVWDDYGVHSNKADTQHSSAFDIFKGAFDCLGTEIGVLLATAVDAGEATQQLQNKYNVEVIVPQKGNYKFDVCDWNQDFHGFRNKMTKHWKQMGVFPPLPMEIYKEYDGMRRELTSEAFVRITDALSEDFLDQTLRMIKEADVKMLRLVDNLGPSKYDKLKEELGEDYKLAFTRCKARSLIDSTRVAPNQYRLDLTSLGKDVLDALDKNTSKTKQIPPSNCDRNAQPNMEL